MLLKRKRSCAQLSLIPPKRRRDTPLYRRESQSCRSSAKSAAAKEASQFTSSQFVVYLHSVRTLSHVFQAAPKSKAHVDPDKISHHVHRIGHHFPNEVVDQACNWLGYTGRNGTFEKNFDLAQTSRIAQALEKHKKNSGQGDAANSEQETKEQIQAAMRDLFPRIPNKDMKAIVKHAFRQVSCIESFYVDSF